MTKLLDNAINFIKKSFNIIALALLGVFLAFDIIYGFNFLFDGVPSSIFYGLFKVSIDILIGGAFALSFIRKRFDIFKILLVVLLCFVTFNALTSFQGYISDIRENPTSNEVWMFIYNIFMFFLLFGVGGSFVIHILGIAFPKLAKLLSINKFVVFGVLAFSVFAGLFGVVIFIIIQANMMMVYNHIAICLGLIPLAAVIYINYFLVS